MNASKEECEQVFNRANLQKNNELFSQTRVFQELIMFMDYKIRNQIKTFTLMSLCNGQKTKFMVDNYFQNAFNSLTLHEQVTLYEQTIKIAISIQNSQTQIKRSTAQFESKQSKVSIQIGQEEEKEQPLRFRVEIEKGFRSWQQIHLSIEGFKVSSEDMNFDLRNYLMRRSKKKDRECYVLEAIHQSSPQVLRFCFLTNSDIKKYLPILRELLEKGYNNMIRKMYGLDSKVGNSRENISQKLKSPSNFERSQEEGILSKNNISIRKKVELQPLPEEFELHPTESRLLEEIIKEPSQQNLSLELNELISNENEKFQTEEVKTKEKIKECQRWYKNVFHIMFPSFQLKTLDHFDHYKVIASTEQAGCFVFQHVSNPQIFKLELLLNIQPEIAIRGITNVPLYKLWHPEVVQGDLKLGISSDNSAISYQKHREYSKWYRERDFLYLRHIFKMDDDYFIADKSIENTNFIPFQTINRGRFIYQIFKISSSASGSRLVMECQIDHGGLLNKSHAQVLTLRYLLGFQKMETYFKKVQFQGKLRKYFNINWKVKQILSLESSSSLREKEKVQIADSQFSADAISRIDDSDVFFSIKDQGEEDESDKKSIHQKDEEDIKWETRKRQMASVEGQEKINLDSDGLIVLPKDYLKVRHPTGVVEEAEKKKIFLSHQNILLKDVWKMLDTGGLVLINKKMMAAQDNVLSHIIGTLKKNLFSGKGALNISLPVTIFNCDSQLSRYAAALGSAPEFLQQAAKVKNPVERMKYTMILGLTHSLLFFDMEKPFNPILGETFQCFIAGCPFYAQQISHHPPITAILMLGRGYKIYGSIEATVSIHLNAADGINEGWYHVVFDDGQEICFQTPPAEFSGFTLGDRKFQFKEKGYYFDNDNNLYGEMKFEDTSGVFSSNKWKYRDQIEGQIFTVKSDFLNKFISAFPDKKHSPSSKDILERHSKLEGRWPLDVRCDGQLIYNINVNLPYEMISYQYPLNSNTNYREDLYYRKMEDLSRSQSQKERLENIQRGDRKFRAKYHGPSNH